MTINEEMNISIILPLDIELINPNYRIQLMLKSRQLIETPKQSGKRRGS